MFLIISLHLRKKNKILSLLIFDFYIKNITITLTDYLACSILCNQKMYSFICLKSVNNSNPFWDFNIPKSCQFHATTLKCQSKCNLDTEANRSMHFKQQNLQDPVIMASYIDAMNRNYILFQNILYFLIIVPVLQC